jgi:hypothetical protein
MKRASHRRRRSLAPLLMSALAFVPAAAAAQRQQQFRETTVVKIEAGAWTGPTLPDGQPDVEGHWSNTIGNHNNLTNPQGGGGRGGGRGERAPSRVSDPPDGQVPFQAWARAKQEEFRDHLEDPIKPEYVEPLARVCARRSDQVVHVAWLRDQTVSRLRGLSV